MGSLMGQFSLRNGFLLIISIGNVNPVGQWGKNLVMAMGFVDLLGQYSIYHDKVFLIWMKK